MALNARLSDLKLFSSTQLSSLSQNNINTTQQLLCVPNSKLRYILDTSTLEEASNYVRNVIFKTNIISQNYLNNPRTGLQLYNEKQNKQMFLPLKYIPSFNTLFHGGIPLNMITEIVGATTSGKSEFCLSAVSDLLMEFDKFGCVIFDTEVKQANIFQRIYFMMKNRNPDMSESEIEERILKKCTIIHVASSKELIDSLDNLEEFIFEKNIKLIVIDSLATLSTKEFQGKEGGAFERASILQTEATLLKQLNEKFKVGVLVTNSLSSSDEAQLGINWYHFVNHRLKIYKIGESKAIINIVKSSIANNVNIHVNMADLGLQEVEDMTH